jgi:hypothetical protein
MAEEPTKGNSRGYLKVFFLTNPTVVLSLLYLYVTGIGMLYSSVLYGRFGINVFDYSEIGDFLLAAFKNPVAFLSGGLLAAVGAVLLYYRAFRVRRRLRAEESQIQAMIKERDQALEESQELAKERYQRARQDFLERHQRVREMHLHRERLRTGTFAIIIALTSVYSTVVLPYYSAGRTASSIKAGETPSVDVRYRSFKGSAGQVTVPGLRLIGATEKAAFFYDVDHKRTIAIPQAQLVSIEVPE